MRQKAYLSGFCMAHQFTPPTDCVLSSHIRPNIKPHKCLAVQALQVIADTCCAMDIQPQVQLFEQPGKIFQSWRA